MGDVIQIAWFIDSDGRTYLGRLTPAARRIKRNTKVTPQAEKAIDELHKRLDHARRQA